MEKRDIHNVNGNYAKYLDKFIRDSTIIKKNKKIILEFLRDAELGKTIKNRAKKKIGISRRYKYLYYMKSVSFWLNKPFTDVTQKDMEEFILNLERDNIKKRQPIARKKEYSDATKLDIKKSIIKLYKYLAGKHNKTKYLSLINWIDTSLKEIEIPALSRKEIEKVANICTLLNPV